MDELSRRTIAPNVAMFVGAGTVREAVLGDDDVQPTRAQLTQMQRLVRKAMEQGALGLTDMLIYTPATFAKQPELIALAKVSAACGGIYTVHMRSEGARLEEGGRRLEDLSASSSSKHEQADRNVECSHQRQRQ